MPEGSCLRSFLRVIAVAAAFLVIAELSAGVVHAELPVMGKAATADAWLRVNGDTPLLTAETCAELARVNVQRGLTYDLTAAADARVGDLVRMQIHAAAQGYDETLPDLYDGGQPLTAER